MGDVRGDVSGEVRGEGGGQSLVLPWRWWAMGLLWRLLWRDRDKDPVVPSWLPCRLRESAGVGEGVRAGARPDRGPGTGPERAAPVREVGSVWLPWVPCRVRELKLWP